MRTPAAFLCSLCLLVTVAVTYATAVCAASASDAIEAQGQMLFARGQTAYAEERYADALQAFVGAHQKIPVAALLFNIGQCHRKLGQHAQAAEHFQRYLDEETDEIPNRAEVEALAAEERELAAAEQAAAEQAAAEAKAAEAKAAEAKAAEEQAAKAQPLVAEAAAPVAAPAPAEPALYEQPVFWGVVGGVALAALVGSAVLVVVATPPPSSTTLGTFDVRNP